MYLIINISYQEAKAQANSLKSGTEVKPFVLGDTYKAGEFVDYLGKAYLVVPKNGKTTYLAKYHPPRDQNFELNMFESVLMIYETFNLECLEITILNGFQVWVFLKGGERKAFNELSYSEDHYSKVHVHGVGENNISTATRGLLAAYDSKALDDYLTKE